MMRALLLQAEHEMPRVEEVRDPEPGDREVLIKVAAAGMNYADTMMRRGFYIHKPAFPYVPGFEFSGVIQELGPGVIGWNQAIA